MSTIDLGFDPTDAELDHARVLLEALRVHHDRQGQYGDNWRESGWRGALFKLRLRCSRAWDALWGVEEFTWIGVEGESGSIADLDTDDLIDCINFAAQAVILVREGNRDGSWRYDR